MPDPSKPTDWLNKIPAGLTAVFALIGTIAAFVIDFRERWRLFTTITIVLLLAYIFAVSLYVILARRKTRSKTNPWTYPYARYRPLGLIGLVAVCLAATGLIAAPATRQFAMDGILGTQTPIPTPTAPPTSTPIPTPTLVPTPTPVPPFTPVPPARVEDPDVWIAQFKVDDAVANLMAEHRIEKALRDELEQFQGQTITVRVDGPPIETFSQAQDILNNGKTKVVIWGEYGQHGTVVRMLLSGGAGDGSLKPVTVIDILPDAEDPVYELSFTIEEINKEIVPRNVSFMSLFVIGHLAYLSNDYETGHEAFDAAMDKIPDEVVIENEAILSFFRAREMHKREVPDLAGAICAYVNAIQADRESGVVGISDVAYNNLGLVISKFYELLTRISSTPETPIPPEADSCLQQLGLLANEYQDPKILFQRALDINPNLTLARYNKIVFEWLQSEDKRSPENIAQFRYQLDIIEMEDESIVGTYILRAVIHDELKEYGEALQMYLRGIEQDSRIPLLHVNVGQVYLSYENNLPEAERHLRAALHLEPDHQEARLALGNLYYRSDRFAEAIQKLDVILAPGAGGSSSSVPVREALILRSGVAAKQADIPGAKVYLNQAIQLSPSDPYLHVLLGLLHQSDGRLDEAALSFETARGLNTSVSPDPWATFKRLCFSDGQLPTPFADWMRDQLPSSTCLGRDLNDPNQRRHAFYDLFSDSLLPRRDPAVFYLLGAQCPYVYTQDPITGEWEFQTTILYKIVDREAAQRRPLSQFHGKLLIREEEPEISYLNQLYLLAEMLDGSYRILEPGVQALKQVDADYMILHQGEELLVTLEGYPVSGDVKQWWVMAVGYYSPVR